jgi:hypothetical protein
MQNSIGTNPRNGDYFNHSIVQHNQNKRSLIVNFTLMGFVNGQYIIEGREEVS